MRKVLLAIVIIIQVTLVFGIFDDYQPSARARAMGNAYVSVSDDPNAVFYNPAGLTLVSPGGTIGFTQLNGMSFTELKTGSVVNTLPRKFGSVALGVQMFDVDFEDVNLLAEQKWTLAHGFTLLDDIHSTIRIGWAMNLFYISMEGFDSDTAMGVDIGALATLHQRTRFGFAVTNFNQPSVGANNQHKLPRNLKAGISYMPYDQVITSIEMKKDFAEDTEFMGGVEVKMFEPLSIRAGVHQNPSTWSAGLGYQMAGVKLDYSFTRHAVLNDTHFLNIGYQWRK